MNHFKVLFGVLLVCLLVLPASATPMVFNTGDGDPAWGVDTQVVITDVNSPPWAPNGTTGVGALWVNKVDSGFQGGGPALGTLTVYTLTIPDVITYQAWVLADDGAHVEVSIGGAAFFTLVNSSGAPQGMNCSSLEPSCTSNKVWDSGVLVAGGQDVVLRFTTSQDVANTPMGIQATIAAEQVPEPTTMALMGIGLLTLGAFHRRRRQTNQ